MSMNQKTRSLVTLLGLLVAVGGAGLFAYYGVHEKQASEKEAKEKKEKLFDFDKAKVTGLTVTAKGQTTILAAKKPQGWEVVSPVHADADAATVDSLVEKLLGLRSKMVVEEKSADLAKFGLDKPALKVVAKLEDGTERVLRSGIENPFDNSVYVATGDSSDVIQAEGGFKWALEKDTFELRDKRVVPFEESAARKLTVRVGTNRYELEKKGNAWELVSPLVDRADEAGVNRLLGTLRNLHATKFVTDTATPADEPRYGLDAPRLEATLTLDGGAVMTLVVGGGDDGGVMKAFARRREAVFIAEVPDSIFTDLDVKAADLRDKTVLGFEKDKVQAIRFGFGDESVTVERAAATDAGPSDDWKVTKPAPAEAKKWKLNSLLWTLTSLKANAFADENPTDLAQYGLDKPARTMTLLGSDGKELGTLSVGKEDGDKVFVMGSSARRVLEVEKSRLQDLPATRAEVEEAPKADAGTPAAAAQ